METTITSAPFQHEHPLYDVVIVGAGIAGIGAAYWLQQKCPQKQFVILEARDNIGGTWDLFRYPGIRSDSDMFTFGYRFKPWENPKSLSDGASILAYLQETVRENSIDKNIRFGHRVQKLNWCSKEACWTIEVQTARGVQFLRSRFVYMCSGYYSYEEAYRPVFEGEAKYKGTIVLPQFWPQDLDYSGKQVLIVGSGATAVTLVPAMAQTAGHVTMLQRSPTYIANLPNRDGLYRRLKKWLPNRKAYRITRWKNLLVSMLVFSLSRAFPGFVKRLIMKGAAKQLPPGYKVDKHFNPSYNPWDQRLCVVPDGDLFTAIRSGKASVVTDKIDHFTERGVLLVSGQELQADIIVLATGLKVRLLGGAQLTIDGKAVNTNEVMVYKGMLISDVPNFAIAFGYTNASWTLKTDLTANYICKLLNYMDRSGYAVVVPRKEAAVEVEPFLNFDAGYIKRANHILPQQGSRRPWRVYQNYFLDMITTRFGRIADGVLQFESKK
jgi:cyclohexanone monooxygenase